MKGKSYMGYLGPESTVGSLYSKARQTHPPTMSWTYPEGWGAGAGEGTRVGEGQAQGIGSAALWDRTRAFSPNSASEPPRVSQGEYRSS